MLARLATGVACAGALALAPLPGWGVAAAEAPAQARGARGAIVVAVTKDAGPPARSLAHEIYRDATLRPSIDNATARVLAGDAPPEPPTEPAESGEADAERGRDKLREMAEIRASLASAGSEAASRRLLASLGAETGSILVIAVTSEAGRPAAKVLSVASMTYERVELGATIETALDGARSFLWPGATATLKGLLPKPEIDKAAPSPPPRSAAAPREVPQKSSKESKTVWSSPWFWGTLGGVAAIGVTVFILSRTTADPSTVHLDGRVGP